MLTLRSIDHSIHSAQRVPDAAFPLPSPGGVPINGRSGALWTALVFSVLLIAGLCSCNIKTKAAGATGPSASGVDAPVGFSGKWAARHVDGAKLKSRTLELGRDGRFVECYEEALFGRTGQRIFDTSLCQRGRWFDLGTAGSIHRDLRFVAKDRDDLVPLFAEAHLLELDPENPDPAIARNLHRYDGMLLTRIGDSLVYVGDFQVYRGGYGRLDSTIWVRPGGFVDSLFLGADGTAIATVNGVPWVEGKWNIDFTSTLMAQFHLFNRAIVLQGNWGVQGDKLILTDFEDPSKYGWEGPAGH